jgi:hypothetical protein
MNEFSNEIIRLIRNLNENFITIKRSRGSLWGDIFGCIHSRSLIRNIRHGHGLIHSRGLCLIHLHRFIQNCGIIHSNCLINSHGIIHIHGHGFIYNCGIIHSHGLINSRGLISSRGIIHIMVMVLYTKVV